MPVYSEAMHCNLIDLLTKALIPQWQSLGIVPLKPV